MKTTIHMHSSLASKAWNICLKYIKSFHQVLIWILKMDGQPCLINVSIYKVQSWCAAIHYYILKGHMYTGTLTDWKVSKTHYSVHLGAVVHQIFITSAVSYRWKLSDEAMTPWTPRQVRMTETKEEEENTVHTDFPKTYKHTEE